jgi:hypothetical protein
MLLLLLKYQDFDIDPVLVQWKRITSPQDDNIQCGKDNIMVKELTQRLRQIRL